MNFGRQSEKGSEQLLCTFKMEAGEETLGLSRWQKAALGQLGGLSIQELLKLTYLSTGLWLWRRLHSSEPRKNEEKEGCISLSVSHQIRVANSHRQQSPRQMGHILSALLRLSFFFFSLHSLLHSKAAQDLDHNVSEPWSLCLGQALHLQDRKQKNKFKEISGLETPSG